MDISKANKKRTSLCRSSADLLEQEKKVKKMRLIDADHLNFHGAERNMTNEDFFCAYGERKNNGNEDRA